MTKESRNGVCGSLISVLLEFIPSPGFCIVDKA
jgi:hypothetical protein